MNSWYYVGKIFLMGVSPIAHWHASFSEPGVFNVCFTPKGFELIERKAVTDDFGNLVEVPA